MSPTHTRIFVAIIFGFALTTFEATTSSADLSFEDAADKAKIHKLIETLGSDKFSARKSAAQELERMVSDKPLWVTHYLFQQEYQHDPETRVRVEKVLKLKTDGVKYKITDSIGQPITDAIVETYAVTDHLHRFTLRGGKLMGRSLADANGFINTHPKNTPSVTYSVRIYAPQYGLAGCVVPPLHRNRPIRLPLVRDGTREAERSPQGTVFDASGQPVADAAVLPSFIEAPSGAARSLPWEAWALTDQSGQFRVYRTLDRDDKKLLPPNATMNVRITSRSNDLFPTLASLNSGAAKKITLVRVTQFHKFALLVPGQYEVYVQDLAFHRLTVTEDSPETITFLPKMQKTISGRVVDGTTGQPFSGAVVFLYSSRRQGEFAALSTDQWNSLAAADPETLTAHPAYKALSDVYGIQGMGRSDSDGRFELFPEQVGSVYGVIAMSAEKLPVARRIPSLDELLRRKNPKLARINRDVGSMPMFQAAKIKLFPRLKGELENKNVSFWPEWEFVKEDQPEWFDKLFASYDESRHGLPTFYPCQYLAKSNRPHHFIVPAGVRFKFGLDAAYTEAWSPLFLPGVMHLESGETIDLGEVVSAPTVSAVVQVVDAGGRGVEGCPIRFHYLTHDHSWHIGKITDQAGYCTMRVGANISGEVGVIGLRGPREITEAANLKLPFFLAQSPADPFVIELTDEQVAAIPKDATRP